MQVGSLSKPCFLSLITPLPFVDRLIPLLAAAYVHHVFSHKFFENFVEFNLAMMSGEKGEKMGAMGQEIHAVSSAGKPMAGWMAQARNFSVF